MNSSYKYLFCFIILFFGTLSINAQNVSGKHTVKQTDNSDEYVIKTQITGLKDVDIARVIYSIKSTHTYKKSANNTFFASSKNDEVKFYIMAIPPSGVLNIEFNLLMGNNGKHHFPVRIEYSKNEEKKLVKLSELNIENDDLIASSDKYTGNEENLIAEQKAKEEAAAKLKEEQTKNEEESKRVAAEKQKEEEKLAANIARFNAEQEAKKQKEQEETKRLADEKAKNDKLLAEQKTKDEATAKLEEEKEEAKRLADEKAKNDKLLAEQKAKEEANAKLEEEQEEAKRLADEKAKNNQLIAVQKAKEEAAAKLKEEESEKANRTITNNGKTYSVQILSLSKFSQNRLDSYCSKHNLSQSDIIKRNINGYTKISIGKVNTQKEATSLQRELKTINGINESFIVVLP